MSAHTPGGWNRNIPPASEYPIIFAGRNTHVAQVITRGLSEQEAEANANLIAAAPDLLEALRIAEGAIVRLIAAIEQHHATSEYCSSAATFAASQREYAQLSEVRAALAKAGV